MTVQNPQHLALGIGASVRGGVIDAGQNPARLPVVGGALHRDNPLPDRRQHFPSRKFISDATGQSNAFDQRSGRSLKRVGATLQKWNASGKHQPVIDHLSAQVQGLCAKLPAADPQHATCEGVLKAPAKA